MSNAIRIPSQGSSHAAYSHLDIYSKTFSGHGKVKGVSIADRGRHISDTRRFDSADRDSDCDEPSHEQTSSSLTDKPVWGGDIKNYLLRPGRALVNPFDPSNVTVKLTSNRRRWTHIFPKGPGASSHLPLQNTAVTAVPHHARHPAREPAPAPPPGLESHSPGSSCSGHTTAASSRHATLSTMDTTLRKISDFSVAERMAAGGSSKAEASRLGSMMWDAGTAQCWDAELTTGVDWRSITWPACLPITTDYFPDRRAFENDYVFNQYVIVPDEINSDYATRSPLQKPALTTREVFLELICQRLSQGFQLIINQNDELSEMVKSVSSGSQPQNQTSTISNLSMFLGSKSVVNPSSVNKASTEHFWLSIGKNFHHISLTGNTIDVVIYRPRHPYPALDYHYSYRFMAPDNDTYEVSWVEFNMEKLENYSWNYLDHYVCTRGDQDFGLAENLKYWRSRMYVLPLKPFVPFTTSIRDGPASMRCDVYKKPTAEEYVNLAEGFMR